jgi:hypothetical protein
MNRDPVNQWSQVPNIDIGVNTTSTITHSRNVDSGQNIVNSCRVDDSRDSAADSSALSRKKIMKKLSFKAATNQSWSSADAS